MDNLIILFVLLGLLSMIPNFKLFKYYMDTKITEFVLFAMMFMSASLFFISLIFASSYDSLTLWKITAIFLNTTFYLIIHHALRLMWHKPPKLLTYTITIWWVTLLGIVIFLWEIIPAYASADVIFLHMNANQPIIRRLDYDVGYQMANGTIVYSYQFNLISLLFMFTAAIANIIGYFTVKVVSDDITTRKAQKTMQFATLSLLSADLLSIFPMPYSGLLSGIFLFITFSLINYISFRHPTVLLITHAQIIRSMEIYNDLQNVSELKSSQYQDEMIAYLNRISSILRKS